MLSKELRLAVHQLRKMGFERFGDLCVQLLARAAQQTAMRSVLHQRMFESINRLGWRASLEDQLGSDETGESRLQLIVGKTRHGMHQRIGKLASHRRADLGYQTNRRQAVQPRHQRVTQTRRDREWWQSAVEHIAISFLAQQTTLEYALRQLLD